MQSNRPILIVTKTCPNCRRAMDMLMENNVRFDRVLAEEAMDICKKLGIKQAPTLIVGEKTYTGLAGIGHYIYNM